MKFIAVNSWTKYQHYSHRKPPWIKYHCEFLEKTKAWSPDERLVALLLMPLAAREDNRIPDKIGWLSVELGLPDATIKKAIPALIKRGFLVHLDASAEQADLASDASEDASAESENGDRDASISPLYISVSSVSSGSEEKVSKAKTSKAKSKAKYSADQRKPIWDALTEVLGYDVTTGSAISDRTKAVNLLLDAGATPEEVVRRGRLYLERYDWTLTARSLEKHWDALGTAPASSPTRALPEWVASASPDLRAVLEQYPDRVWAEEPVWWQQKVEDGLTVDGLVWLLTREG